MAVQRCRKCGCHTWQISYREDLRFLRASCIRCDEERNYGDLDRLPDWMVKDLHKRISLKEASRIAGRIAAVGVRNVRRGRHA